MLVPPLPSSTRKLTGDVTYGQHLLTVSSSIVNLITDLLFTKLLCKKRSHWITIIYRKRSYWHAHLWFEELVHVQCHQNKYSQSRCGINCLECSLRVIQRQVDWMIRSCNGDWYRKISHKNAPLWFEELVHGGKRLAWGLLSFDLFGPRLNCLQLWVFMTKIFIGLQPETILSKCNFVVWGVSARWQTA